MVWSGRVAVITGAAQGIGLSIARSALLRGMNVVLSDYQAELLAATHTALVAEFGATRVGQLACDVSKPEQVDALAEHAFKTFGGIHFLVNNAGVAMGKLSWEHSLADWQWTLGVNLMGVVHGIRSFVPKMLASNEPGVVLNVASVAGVLSAPGMGAYNVSKHGVVTLSETLFHEFRQVAAKLNAAVLCPAWVRTGISKSHKHRPSDLKNPDQPATEFEKQLGGAIDRLVTNARLTPDDVAEFVFEGLDKGNFYLFPHSKVKADMQARFDALLAEGSPALSQPK